MEEEQTKDAIEIMISFVIAHKRDIANGLNDFGDLKPALKWINEMDIVTKQLSDAETLQSHPRGSAIEG